MQCAGTTKAGNPCRNQASRNGYCHLHGGVLSRRAERNAYEREYQSWSPERRRQADANRTLVTVVVVGLFLLILLIMGLATGKWEGPFEPSNRF